MTSVEVGKAPRKVMWCSRPRRPQPCAPAGNKVSIAGFAPSPGRRNRESRRHHHLEQRRRLAAYRHVSRWIGQFRIDPAWEHVHAQVRKGRNLRVLLLVPSLHDGQGLRCSSSALWKILPTRYALLRRRAPWYLRDTAGLFLWRGISWRAIFIRLQGMAPLRRWCCARGAASGADVITPLPSLPG